jgi:hypothetical protein
MFPHSNVLRNRGVFGPVRQIVFVPRPGTSDEHLSAVQLLSAAGLDGALVVSTPQEVALLDVRKQIRFCASAAVRVLGVLENMTLFVCPNCQVPHTVLVPFPCGAIHSTQPFCVVEGKGLTRSTLCVSSTMHRIFFDTRPPFQSYAQLIGNTHTSGTCYYGMYVALASGIYLIYLKLAFF